MLLYEEMEFTLQELIIYLNNLENKSNVLELSFEGHEVKICYDVEYGDVNQLIVKEQLPGKEEETEFDFLRNCFDYGIITEKVFSAKICGWKEISYLELISIILNNTVINNSVTKLAFQIEGSEDLYLIDGFDDLVKTINKFKEIYYDDEVIFFKEY